MAVLKILAVNSGSSSFKLGLFDSDGPEFREIWQARGEWSPGGGRATRILRPLIEPHLGQIDAVGHRIVHGGPSLRHTVRLSEEVRAEIARASVSDPEHGSLILEAIDSLSTILNPDIPQFAVFDTAFFTSLAPSAYVYPLPYEWCAQGIHRYGFHGISHQYVSRRAAAFLGDGPARIITCHLGNGSSLAAVCDGRAVDTTMGFTPLEGLMMGTRSGTIDPAIPTFLIRDRGMLPPEVDRILNEESGLKGVSGVSGDMREVMHARDGGNERAALAIDVFVHRLRREMGGMLATLGGLEAIVFTGGIGEHTPEIRRRAAEAFAFLGARIDAAKNDAPPPGDCDLSAPESKVRLLLVPTREEEEIAREVAGGLSPAG